MGRSSLSCSLRRSLPYATRCWYGCGRTTRCPQRFGVGSNIDTCVAPRWHPPCIQSRQPFIEKSEVHWRPPVMAMMLLVVALTSCSDRDGKSVVRTPASPPTVSPECREAFRLGHEREAAGEPTFQSFLPSVERCGSLREWTDAARASGVDLHGREATFVNRACAEGDARIQGRLICTQARAQDRGTT
jgi:hypothetical protein